VTNNGEYDTEINYSLPRFQLLAQATIIVGRISLVTYNLLLSLQIDINIENFGNRDENPEEML